MINFLLVKDKEIPVYLKYWYYKTKIEGLVFNKIYEATKVGTSLVLDNTIEHTMKINLLASDTTQFTTSGKNLFDGEYEIGGYNIYTGVKENNLAQYRNKNFINVKPSTEYIFSINGIPITEQPRYFFYDENKNFISSLVTSNTFTTPNNCYFLNWHSSGLKTNYPDGISNAQIEEGSTATPFEQYTGGQPSPNPDYSQEIHVVKGDNNINISNKNLFGGFIFTKTSGGITFNYYKDGTITAKGIAIAQALSLLSSEAVNNNFLIKLQPGTYTIQGGISNIFVQVCDKQGSTIVETNSSTSFTINNEKDIFVRIRIPSGTDLSNGVTIYPQLEEGTTATSYVAHEEQSYTITLGEIELCKIGDYQDLIFKNIPESEYYDSILESGKWYKYGVIGKYVFDGSENITIFNSDARKTVFQVGDITNLYKYSINTSKPILLTTKFISISQSDNWVSGNISLRRQDEANLKVYFILETNKTVNELRNIILDEPLYFLTATPTKTLLSDTLQEELEDLENATSYNEQTNITQINDDRSFILDVSYFRKVKYNE